MNEDKGIPIESLGAWLENKPFWERYIWKLNLEKESLTDEDIDLCYQYLSEYLGIIEPIVDNKPDISFKNIFTEPSIVEASLSFNTEKKKIIEIKNFSNVNAISNSCSIKLGTNLTLVYGENGSGKSGVGRLLCNACFSRGEREILPNVKDNSIDNSQAKATFVVEDASGETKDIEYSFGDNIDYLKRFSVFDSESVLIHLDQSNNVNFTPAQIKIFDKVAETVSKLEEKLVNEVNIRRKANPFSSMFLVEDATSDTAIFCKNIKASTKIEDLLKHTNFDPTTDEPKIEELKKLIDNKKKLDITKKKTQLNIDKQNLLALKATLERITNCFNETQKDKINKVISDISEKKKITEKLSVQSFDDGILKTIGSPEWKALIITAKTLYENEKIANENNDPLHCILCHQPLSYSAKTLFQKYWQFLESKAESELVQLILKQKNLLDDLRSIKALYPKFLPTDAGLKILEDEDSNYLKNLKAQFSELSDILDNWINKIGKQETVSMDKVPMVNLERIAEIINAKTTEESKLVDPSAEIAILTANLNNIKHKKEASAVKDAALEYLSYLKWLTKTNQVNFSGIKMATTKKRTESFLARVGSAYKVIFNQELVNLRCDFNLTMHTSGDQGNTVKVYRLDFAEDYNPSQILSEGEQNACSLADFLTEIQLDNKNCGIIFDDPVTSLDHERKDSIAERLTKEAKQRQVLILTHDKMFMSQLVKHATKYGVPFVPHWMRKIDGVPGYVENNTSPKLATVTNLKMKAQEAVKDLDSLNSSEKEIHLGSAFDYLRSACEALIEEVLFSGTIQRNDDYIKVHNLEEVVFDKDLALKIVDLHGRISAFLLAHNRSDMQTENSPQFQDFKSLQKEFNELEADLKKAQKESKNERVQRRKNKKEAQAGW